MRFFVLARSRRLVAEGYALATVARVMPLTKASTNVVTARLNMTWISTFQTPGDLGSRGTQKQGIDTFLKLPNGGVFTLDVGQKMTILGGEDLNFKRRWDIALGL